MLSNGGSWISFSGFANTSVVGRGGLSTGGVASVAAGDACGNNAARAFDKEDTPSDGNEAIKEVVTEGAI